MTSLKTHMKNMKDDVKEGIIASKIAAHAADIAKGIPYYKKYSF